MSPEIWEARRQKLAECAYLSMTAGEAAAETGFSRQTVAKYAEKFGIKFSETSRSADERTKAVAQCAAEGLTRAQAASRLGISIHQIGTIARAEGIAFVHASAGAIDRQRADDMAGMYRAGRTLEEIGSLYSLSRERVRQIISKVHRMSADDGGRTVRTKVERARRRAQREAECYRKHGCSTAQHAQLRKMGRDMMRGGASRDRTPIGAFCSQRQSAKARGIGWSLLLWEWWTIWQESGHWEDRGRAGDAYVMCRFRYEGGYEIGNVYIATLRHNSSVQPNNPYRTSHPDHLRLVEGRRTAA